MAKTKMPSSEIERWVSYSSPWMVWCLLIAMDGVVSVVWRFALLCDVVLLGKNDFHHGASLYSRRPGMQIHTLWGDLNFSYHLK
jgi:hypothetical protein